MGVYSMFNQSYFIIMFNPIFACHVCSMLLSMLFLLVAGSRLTSPRPTIIGKSRKRALSHSPISDYLDIQSLTRSSEGSLQLAPLLAGHSVVSRSSSAASGSYGHLSAGQFSNVIYVFNAASSSYGHLSAGQFSNVIYVFKYLCLFSLSVCLSCVGKKSSYAYLLLDSISLHAEWVEWILPNMIFNRVRALRL